MSPAARASAAAPTRPLARLLLGLLIATLLLAPGAGSAVAKPKAMAEPELDASAWVLIDARDGSRVAGAAASEQLPIASATKLMTAYLTLQRLELDQKLVAAEYQAAPAESVLGLGPGERISVRDLLVALMLPSANDAAVTLAEGISGSEARFVDRMNAAARRLGLAETSYANPIGLDDRNNHSSARDLVDLARLLRAEERFRKIVSKPEATLKSGARRRKVATRNSLLLADRSVDGVKTGHTRSAGYVLVASAEREGVPLISAILGAGSEAARDRETEKLLDYGFSLYRERAAVREGEVLATVPITHESAPLEAVAARDLEVAVRQEQTLTEEVLAPAQLQGPVSQGQRVGSVRILLGGDGVGRVSLRASREVAAPGVLEEVGSPAAVALIAGGSMLVLVAILVAVRRARRPGRGSRTPEERMRSHRKRSRRRPGGEGGA